MLPVFPCVSPVKSVDAQRVLADMGAAVGALFCVRSLTLGVLRRGCSWSMQLVATSPH